MPNDSRITHCLFGHHPDFSAVRQYTLENGRGVRLKVLDYGGIITSLSLPDRHGNRVDVVLGSDSFEPYIENPVYLGAIIGRYCNRINEGRFLLEGKNFQLSQNMGNHHLHGGVKGLDKKLWTVTELISDNAVALKLHTTSADGEEGFPGNLSVEVTYSLTDADELMIEYSANTDKATVINLTNHSYFNLSGETDIRSHCLRLDASTRLETDKDAIPTGNRLKVADTAFDFRSAKPIGQDIEETGIGPGGYDHTYIFDHPVITSPVAEVVSPSSGIRMQLFTDQPGVQLYTSNHFDGSIQGRPNGPYGKFAAFCLETQHFPDSPNHPHFPSTQLMPGETFYSLTIYRFDVVGF